jgi:penicillin-binding protein 1C
MGKFRYRIDTFQRAKKEILAYKKVGSWHKHRKRWIKCFIFLVLLVCYYFSLPKPLFKAPYSTVVESNDGRLLGARIAADGQWRFPSIQTAPYKFKQAIIHYEDKRFKYHLGIDPIAMSRALLQNIQSKKIISGGSTLSMQVIRLSRQKKKRNFWNKSIETVLATRLELGYSKESILAMYASNAPFGGNVVGIEAAAWRYFGHTVEELSWAEAATLAVLPNAPALIHISKNRERLKTKRNQLLLKLHKAKIISEMEYDLAIEEELPEKPHPLPMFVYHLTNRIAKEQGNVLLQTTLDYNLQRRVSEIAARKQGVYKSNQINNMAILVAEVKTGKILAYIGNVFEKEDKKNGSNVDVIMSPRSSGSVFKPLLYAAMLDEGEILPNTLIPDIPTIFGSFTPKNFNQTFDGAVPAHRVLERSLNVPSVALLQRYGIEKFIHLLKKTGFTTVHRGADNYGLTLILGGAECTLWDLVNVYAKLTQKANAEKTGAKNLFDIHFYNNISPQTESLKNYPYELSSLWLAFESLSQLSRQEEESQWQTFSSSRKIAWKTGTSFGNRDAWSIGVTPEYAVGVWVGNASGEGRPALTGVGYAAPVMFDVFALLPQTTWFQMPKKEMLSVKVCTKSGHLASNLCPETMRQWIPKAGMNTASCPYHIEVNLSADRKYRVNSHCESVSNMRREVYFVLPPVQAWYYKNRNADYLPLPPISPKCSSTFGVNPLALIYPRGNVSVLVPRKLEGETNAVVFQATNTNPQAIIFWHIDNEYVGSTTSPHRIAVNPATGKHTLTLVDSEGFVVKQGFEVE